MQLKNIAEEKTTELTIKTEDILSVSNFNNICRICLVSGALKSLFTCEDEESTAVLDFMKNCASLEVDTDDGLPKNVCNECAMEVLRVQCFIEKCQEADKKLRLTVSFSSLKSEDDSEGIVCDVTPSDCEGVTGLKPVRTGLKFKRRARTHRCEVCAREFPNRKRLCSHMFSHTKEKPCVCRFCGRGFSFSHHLKRHMMIHTGERPHVCKICGKGFIQSGCLISHLKAHKRGDDMEIKKAPYTCTQCGQSFVTLACYNTHMSNHKIPTDKEETEDQNLPIAHTCVICNQTYKTKWHLKQHIVTHMERRFLCSQCGKALSTKHGLELHLRVHTGDRPYACGICNKVYASYGGYRTHSLSHTGEKPHQCQLCPKAFKARSHLIHHLRTHSGERPYPCTFCDKAFALKANLTVHTRTHTGEKPYVCPVCDKGFYDSSGMKKHLRGHDRDTDVTIALPELDSVEETDVPD